MCFYTAKTFVRNRRSGKNTYLTLCDYIIDIINDCMRMFYGL